MNALDTEWAGHRPTVRFPGKTIIRVVED